MEYEEVSSTERDPKTNNGGEHEVDAIVKSVRNVSPRVISRLGMRSSYRQEEDGGNEVGQQMKTLGKLRMLVVACF